MLIGEESVLATNSQEDDSHGTADGGSCLHGHCSWSSFSDYISSCDYTYIHNVCVFVLTLIQGRTRAVGAQWMGFFLGVGRAPGSCGTEAGL